MNIIKVIFSYDRPLQLWGLVQSILDNTDLDADQIVCLCKSSDWDFRNAYEIVEAELGCRIVHERHPTNGLQRLLFRRNTLHKHLMRLIQGSEFVSLAVDDMFYFREAIFAQAAKILQENRDICLWSWRIGSDLQPHDSLQIMNKYWVVPHASTVMPYRYIFHTDGSLFRTEDLEYWLGLIPKKMRKGGNLNQIEGHLAKFSKTRRDELKVGRLHAGPLVQACATWQINKVSRSGGAGFCETHRTTPDHLLKVFGEGERLDYSTLYHRSDWLIECNESWKHPPTHVAPTEQAAKMWACLITDESKTTSARDEKLE